jgi:DNA repair protein RadA/Sms
MFYCKKCGGTSPFWKKYCPVCSRERTLEKRLSLTDNSIDENLNLNEENLDLSELEHLPSGFPIFDRIFDGGFLLTFVYYIWAARGAGKTSFLLQVCSYLESIGKKAVFFSFDESQKSIQKKYVKYGLEKHLSHFVFENNPGVIERTLSEFSPDFVVVDSLQSLVRYNNEMSVPTLDRLKKEA